MFINKIKKKVNLSVDKVNSRCYYLVTRQGSHKGENEMENLKRVYEVVENELQNILPERLWFIIYSKEDYEEEMDQEFIERMKENDKDYDNCEWVMSRYGLDEDFAFRNEDFDKVFYQAFDGSDHLYEKVIEFYEEKKEGK